MSEMPSGNTRHQILQSKVLSRITAGVVSILLVVFFLTTIGNTTTILSKVEMVKNNPYPVSVAAGHLETQFLQLRTVASGAAYMTTSDAVENMITVYKDADQEIRQNLAVINDSQSVNESEARALQEGYDELLKYEEELVKLCQDPNVDAVEVGEYVNANFYPLVTTLLNTDLRILDASTNTVDAIYQTVNDACRQTIFISWILIVAVAISLFVYLALLHRKSIREQMLTEELQDALDMAQSANMAKSTFLSSMSHDIRTPMNAIVGFTEIANSHLDDPERVKNCLERIGVSSRHLLSLINDILDMNEIESGKISLHSESFSISELVEDLTTIVQPQASGRDISLELQAGPLRHDIVMGDSLRIHQVLLNIIGNAVKYTEPAGWVRASVEEQPTESPEVCNYIFVVEDNGIGMDREFIQNIFKPFERARNKNMPVIEGAGLGMSITKNLIDLMGGTIAVESQPNVGSKFTVVVPLQITDTLVVDEPESQSDEGKIGGRVLLVEDDALNREIAIELVQSFGVEVEAACDGVEAVERMRTCEPRRYGLIFMDCQMPRMNGLEATEAIISFERDKGIPHTPIIAMTANAFNEDREKALVAGMDGFMSKPINMNDLEKTLRRYLRAN